MTAVIPDRAVLRGTTPKDVANACLIYHAKVESSRGAFSAGVIGDIAFAAHKEALWAIYSPYVNIREHRMINPSKTMAFKYCKWLGEQRYLHIYLRRDGFPIPDDIWNTQQLLDFLKKSEFLYEVVSGYIHILRKAFQVEIGDDIDLFGVTFTTELRKTSAKIFG